MKALTIGIDFDGTIALHEYPAIGAEIPGAIDTMKKLQANGHRLMLWTMRSGKELNDAVTFLKERGIGLYGANENPQQHTWTDSKKQYAHIYIDDAALGCPLIYKVNDRPYVDWTVVETYLANMGVL